MADTPEAAPTTPVVGTEETSTTSQPTTEATTSTGAETQGEATPVADIPADQIEAFNKFIKGQGGFKNAFNLWKDSIAKGEQKTAQPVQPVQPQSAQTPVAETSQKPQIPTGYMSQQEFMAQQYYNSLANQTEYAPIADKIRSGEVFAEMKKFGIQPMDQNGNINDVQAREFLSLLAKTVPAKPAESPEASQAPTVDYIPTNQGKIDNVQQAMQIISQSAQLKSRGLAEHPDIAAAKEFLKNSWNPAKK